jgi:glutamate carboxypeptidase
METVVNVVGKVFLNELAALDLSVERLSQTDFGDLIIASTPVVSDPNNILLCGHMDTVFPADSPFNWFRQEQGRCFGPGTADMKGGLVVALFALKLLAASGLLPKIPIHFMLNSEEECGSPVSGPMIRKLAANSRAALVFECGGKKGEVVTARKGKLGLRLKVIGKAGHAGYPGAIKRSALLELAHKIISMEDLNGLLPGVTVNVGQAQGGTGANIVPEKAWALIDVRLPDAEAERVFRDELERIASQVQMPGVKTSIDQISSRPPMPASQGNRALFERMKRHADVLGLDLMDESRGGVSDANIIASQRTPVIDGLGPIGGEDHSDREYIITDTLAERVALTGLLIADLSTVGTSVEKVETS